MITACKYLPGNIGNEERELFMVSKGGRTGSGGLELRKGKFFCLVIKKSPREGAQAPAGSVGDESLMGMMKGRLFRRQRGQLVDPSWLSPGLTVYTVPQ